MGVFATRSPFRPNPIGLSSVKLSKIDLEDKEGPVIYVSGCDIMNGTPIYDIKPYLPYADSHPDAVGGFTENLEERRLEVECESEFFCKIPENKRKALRGILEQDPRPSYQNDPERVYRFDYAGYCISFRVEEKKLIVTEIEEI